LIGNLAKVDYDGPYGQTPLYMSVAGQNNDIVKNILGITNGVKTINWDIERFTENNARYNGWTPLTLAKALYAQFIRSGDIRSENAESIIKTLTRKGAVDPIRIWEVLGFDRAD
jgi:hypothetical protein